MSVYGEGRYRTADGGLAQGIRRILPRIAGSWDPVATGGGPLLPVPTDEAKEPDLASIYALTKFTQERSSLIIAGAYGFEAVALRLFNVFGPGQALSNPYTGVLANFGSRLLHGQRPMVFEDGQQRRDFVHVRDVAAAFRLAMQVPDAAGEVYNIGSGRVYTIERVALMLAQAMDRPDLAPEIMDRARAGDIRHCFANIGKARERLGYQPTFCLEETIGELADWIRHSSALDRGEDARRELEAHGLVV